MAEDKLRVRSPNYPSHGLRTSLEQVQRVYAKIQTHEAPRDVVLQHMGYTSYNGASASALSALLKFGLLVKVGADYKLSERAMVILHPHSAKEKAEALQAAARAPALFSELLDRFGGRMPDDSLLRAHLLRNGFAQSAVATAIQALRETVELVDSAGAEYNLAQFTQRGEDTVFSEAAPDAPPSAPPPLPMAPTPSLVGHVSQPLAEDEREFLHGPLSRSVSYRLVLRGDAGPKELGKLIKVLQLQKELLEDDNDEDGDGA